MKDNELQFDRRCHVLYSKPCKKEILSRIALHYPESECEAVWEKVQRQYADYLADWRTDLGGRDNFHNGKDGTYDCIAIMSYYTVCKAVTSFREIEEMEENLILPSFRRLSFADCSKPFWRRLVYKAFMRAKSGCDKWHDYEMQIAPYEDDKPIYYEFTACPTADLAIAFLTDTELPVEHVFFDSGQFAQISLPLRRIMTPFLYLAIKSLYWSDGKTLKKILWCDDAAIKPYFIAAGRTLRYGNLRRQLSDSLETKPFPPLPEDLQGRTYFEFGSAEEHYKYRGAVMKAYPHGNYPVFDGFNHMQYQIRDSKGFAEMLLSVMEENRLPG